MRKQCSKCLRTRKLKFFNENPRYRLGVKGWCRACEAAYARSPKAKLSAKRRWYKKMKDPSFREAERQRNLKRRNPRQQKNTDYKRKYGVSLKRFECATKCALCRQKRKLVPDHDHETGKYRGPLCYRCNLAISQAEKYKNWLKKVHRYLGRR